MPSNSGYPMWTKEYWSPKAREATELGNYKNQLETQSSVEMQRNKADAEMRHSLGLERLKKEYEIKDAATRATKERTKQEKMEALTRYYRTKEGPDGKPYELGGAAANAQYDLDQAELADVTPRGLAGERAKAAIPWAGVLTDADATKELSANYTQEMADTNTRNRLAGSAPYQTDIGDMSGQEAISGLKSRKKFDEYLEENPEMRVPGANTARVGDERNDISRENLERQKEKDAANTPEAKAKSKVLAAQEMMKAFAGKSGDTTIRPTNAPAPKKPVYSFGPQRVSYDVQTSAPLPATPSPQPPDINGKQKSAISDTLMTPGLFEQLRNYKKTYGTDMEEGE